MIKRLMVIAVATVVGMPIVAEAKPVWIDGQTYQGETLGLEPDTLAIDGTQRRFEYVTENKDGKIDKFRGFTAWCVDGNIELDANAPKNYPRRPGWYNRNGYQAAESYAAWQFLNNVCDMQKP